MWSAVLTHSTTWMNLENMIPSKRHEGPQISWFHLHKASTTGKSIEIRRKGLPDDGMRVGEGDVVLFSCVSFFLKIRF